MTTLLYTLTWCAELTTAITRAKNQISMTALSFLPPRTIRTDDFSALWLAIAHAASKGVKLSVILPAPCAAAPATHANETAQAMLNQIGARCMLRHSTNLLHAKTCLIDDIEAWVGSGNFTAAAAHQNRECWTWTDDPVPVRALIRFHAYLADTL